MSSMQILTSPSGGLWSYPEEIGPSSSPAGSVAGIVHDLGNLIQIASSAVRIVARDPSIRTAGLEPVIDGARTSLERAGALVRRIIGTASERAPAIEPVNVETCLAEIEALIQAMPERAIQLNVQTNSDLPLVRCDPLALQNAVLNLVFNARDAMPDGGVISVRAMGTAFRSDEGVEVRVADRGVGMKPDTIARAFEPFFTTKCDGLGGIGLAMVERFAREAGGHVRIESEYGVGTTVTLQLPASRPPSLRTASQPPSSTQRSHQESDQ